jgi:DNA-directed RNA polymerase specialized sigma24 family protein
MTDHTTRLTDDEFADLLEDGDRPIDESTVVKVPPVLRAVAVALDERAAAEQRLVDAIAAARLAGHSWAEIAQRLGVTRQAAHERYARLVPPVPARLRAGGDL